MISGQAARLRRRVLAAVAAFAVTGLPHASAVPVVTPEEAWTRQFGTASRDSASAIAATPAGIYVAGATFGALPGESRSGRDDAFVRKYGVDGNIVWTHQFGSRSYDYAEAVGATAAGIYVAGYTNGALHGESSAGGSDAFVRKYDTNGDVVWTRQFGSASHDSALAVAATPAGIYVAGLTSDDAFVRKYDTNGDVVWTRQFGSASHDSAKAVAATPAGIYVAGRTDGALPGQSSAGNSDAFVRKYGADGNLVWTRQFGSASPDLALAVADAPAGIYVAGETLGALPGQSSAGYDDAFVRKYDTDGNVAWTRQFGGTPQSGVSQDSAKAVAAAPAGIYVAGYTSGVLSGQSSGGSEDAFVRRYDADGNIVWTHQFGGTSYDFAEAVGATSTGIYVAGYTAGGLAGATAGGTEAFVRRYVSYRPDAQISLRASSGYAGNDIYNSTGASQTKSAEVRRGNKKTFFVRAHNDGDERDSFRVDGCRSSNGFKVTYLKGMTGTTAVTRAVVDGTYKLSKVAAGKSTALRAVIEVTSNATVGSIKTCAISITSANRTILKDVVKAKVEARR
ncbi:MAG: hypothetical protein M3285_08370 [Actinomycetota bacterium]|nr:hypothetical protein [Actinomycetota bacterium]